jgi:hypothetical protein
MDTTFELQLKEAYERGYLDGRRDGHNAALADDAPMEWFAQQDRDLKWQASHTRCLEDTPTIDDVTMDTTEEEKNIRRQIDMIDQDALKELEQIAEIERLHRQ